MPAAEQPFHFPQDQTMMPDERLCAAQPVTSALGEMCYNEPQDPNIGTDDMNIINQLLESPAIWAMINDPNVTSTLPAGFELGADVNSSFGNMDVNLNQNFGSYTHFSHYNDLQFNMLVNENQPLQSEPQDSPSNVVQVKTEEEL